MTQNLVRADRKPVGSDVGTNPRPWWRRPWLLPLGVVVVWFLCYVWPPYLGLDPGQSLVPIRQDLAVHYPLVVAHIAFGTLALLTVVLQVWPWLRRTHPLAHRMIGRVYVFGAALPAGVIAILITPMALAPSLGTVLGGVFWLVTTVMGYVRIRQRRFAEHRRWMLYSFAMALNVVWGRIFVVLLPLTPFAGDTALGHVFGAAPWIGWVINLVLVQWWLNRTADEPVVERQSQRG